ncbi:ROK family transcriptional regulator [Nocardioides currus]|uniref:Sugar kinase n=1 Tax=Nocardioides currus TaxID=2133958 RepID=A0A2R7YTX7_9ACTN|nr:ROK family transcriptional regulator [Nocardioides currus]PUA79842.1 sugar kinase [Nocardioides currus]
MTQTTVRVGKSLRPQGKVRQEDARRHHRTLLLQHLFRTGAASRADLARTSGLTRVTVSDLVGEMLADGLVEELGAPAEARVGKPPTLVGMVVDSSHVVSLDLSSVDTMQGAVMNLAGAVVDRAEVSSGGARGTDAVALAVELARTLVERSGRPVLGIGIGSPGIVDDRGTVLDAPNLGWHGTDLAGEVAAATGLPVHVANDANVAALAEHTYGGAAEGGLLVLRVGFGVGAGLILEGVLLHGHAAAAGEIGHVTAEDDGEPCACGRTGCLETLLAVPRLRARLAAADDETALLAATGARLGEVLAPIVGALNVHELVLTGPLDLLDGALRDAVTTTLRRRVMAVTSDSLTVRTSNLGDDVVLVGAAGLVLAGELGVS